MATVRASCTSCGDINLTTKSIQLDRCASTMEMTYSFQCPSCGIRVSKSAQPDVVRVLSEAGVRVHTWTMPASRTEVDGRPPIAYDDLLAFHFQLNDDLKVSKLFSNVL